MMIEEKYLKSQTQATSCMVSFVRGLSTEFEEDEEKEKKTKEQNINTLKPYIEDLVKVITLMLELSLS